LPNGVESSEVRLPHCLHVFEAVNEFVVERGGDFQETSALDVATPSEKEWHQRIRSRFKGVIL
jgi:predicted RNA methylase